MRACLALILMTWSALAWGHRPSDAFVTLNVNGTKLDGQWEVALRDLDVASGVDANHDGAITWVELRTAQPQIASALMQSLSVKADGALCHLAVTDLLINDRLEGRFAWFTLAGECPRAPSQLAVGYHFLFDLDPSHRGILVVHAGPLSHTAVLSPSQPSVDLKLGEASRWREFRDYLAEGIWHIWTGFDHILFLLALLLPGVLVRHDGNWLPVPRLAPAVFSVLGVVTAFTLAHSITLSLAALDVLRLPSRWVESAIAASVFLAAVNNLKPVVTQRRWLVGFTFGLIHGFGFASALSDLGLPNDSRLLCLIAFNLGVETGQLAIVAAVMPLAWLLRGSLFYRRSFQGGSLTVAAIAACWFWQRAF